MTLAIYGAGGLGREVLGLAKRVNAAEGRWDKIVFAADTASSDTVSGIEMLTYAEALAKYPELEFVIAVGEPAVRAVLAEKVSAAGGKLATLVHPDAEVNETAELGAGVVVCRGAFVSSGSKIGENTFLQPCAQVGHDCVIGKNTIISTFVCVAGACFVGDETFIGLNVPVKEKTRIGSRVIISMGAAVFRDIPDNMIAAGNPARVLKENTEQKVF